MFYPNYHAKTHQLDKSDMLRRQMFGKQSHYADPKNLQSFGIKIDEFDPYQYDTTIQTSENDQLLEQTGNNNNTKQESTPESKCKLLRDNKFRSSYFKDTSSSSSRSFSDNSEGEDFILSHLPDVDYGAAAATAKRTTTTRILNESSLLSKRNLPENPLKEILPKRKKLSQPTSDLYKDARQLKGSSLLTKRDSLDVLREPPRKKFKTKESQEYKKSDPLEHLQFNRNKDPNSANTIPHRGKLIKDSWKNVPDNHNISTHQKDDKIPIVNFQEFIINDINGGKSKTVSFNHDLSNLAHLTKHRLKECEQREYLQYIPPISKSISNSTYAERLIGGYEILKKLRRTLDEFGYKRTDQQKIFHDQMINSVIPKIFGDELQCHLSDLLKENGWDQIMQELLCVTPRRFGKTWAVAMFVAAVLICIPDIEVAIFSMAMRASRKMLGLVDKFVSAHPEGRNMIIKPHNQEFLTLKGSSHTTDERKCYSYPGKSENINFPTIPRYVLTCKR